MNSRGWPVFTASFAVVLLAALVGYLVFQRYTPPTSASPPLVPEVRQFALHMHSQGQDDATMHHWMPATIVVNVGDTVVLRVTNGTESAHGFLLAAFDLNAPSIPPGKAVTFRFRPTRPGVYQYGCSLAGCAADHADQVGQFIVLGR